MVANDQIVSVPKEDVKNRKPWPVFWRDSESTRLRGILCFLEAPHRSLVFRDRNAPELFYFILFYFISTPFEVNLWKQQKKRRPDFQSELSLQPLYHRFGTLRSHHHEKSSLV